MTQEEMLQQAMFFYDDQPKLQLSPEEQVELLTRISNMKAPEQFRGMAETAPHILLSVELIFRLSLRVWDIYRPDFIATLSYERQAFLALIGANSPQTEFRYQGLIESYDILPAKSRALFFAEAALPRHRRYWRRTGDDEWLFFNRAFERMDIQARLAGHERLSRPPSALRNDFFWGYPRSFQYQLPNGLRAAINDDSPARFAIERTLCGRRFSKNLFLHLIDSAAKEILASNMEALEKYIPLAPLVPYCASTAPVPLAIRLLPAIEEHAPGTVADAKDVFGNNALWYSLYRETKGADQDALQDLETLLKDLGCDPDALNCLALTYHSVRKAQQALDTVREAYFN